MFKTVVVILFTFMSLLVQSEDFSEFKGRELTFFEEEKIAENLMDWVEVHHIKAAKKLLPNEYSAMKAYGRVDHDVINTFVRTGEPTDFSTPWIYESVKGKVDSLRGALNKLPNYRGTVYRGSSIKDSLLEKLNVGDILHEKAFLSTSTNPGFARNFSASATNEEVSLSAAQFKIDLKSSGRAINNYTFKPDEAEILVKPNTYFQVEAIERHSIEYNFIKLKEIKNPGRHLSIESDVVIYDSFSGDEISLRARSSLFCI